MVVVSDGSTDGTDAWLKQYAEAAPYALRAVSQPNGGPARARNNGIEHARGEVVVFLDDDVEPSPEFLAVHAARHAHQDRTVVIGPMLRDPALLWQEPVWIGWKSNTRPGAPGNGRVAGRITFIPGMRRCVGNI